MTVRTRFAPSPTGYLHVGGARTALFSWLYAKRNGGQCILRIEDTDRERSTEASVQAILEGMAWLGLTFDEGPFHQIDRLSRYEAVSNLLLEKGLAYRCTCSKDRLESLRNEQLSLKQKPRYDGHCRLLQRTETDAPFVVRFKTPLTGDIHFKDEVYGDITVSNEELDDLIMIRSDGLPTYNFAVVVDDWDMRITHVIRGDDHLSNTPRQIHLYQALGAPLPIFAHLPMILGDDGKRLSKRHGAVSVLQFRDMGYLPHALLNYLVRLGWSSQDKEIFSLKEMVALFDLSHVSRGVSSFNYDKLAWLNQHYLRTLPKEEVETALSACFFKDGIDLTHGPSVSDILPLMVERHKTLLDIVMHSRYFYEEELTYDLTQIEKHVTSNLLPVFQSLSQSLDALTQWDSASIQSAIATVCQAFQLGLGKVAQPLRIAVTGSTQSPSIDVTLALIGQKRVIQRLALFINNYLGQ
jgi:glutamyl-tRNA synthetase